MKSDQFPSILSSNWMKGSLVPRHRQYAPLHKHMTSGGECGLFEEEKSM